MGPDYDAMWDDLAEDHQADEAIALIRSRWADVNLNTMSKHVDWERHDLFHLPLETLTTFLCRDVSRHFVIRNDYGLYEYTTYVFHETGDHNAA